MRRGVGSITRVVRTRVALTRVGLVAAAAFVVAASPALPSALPSTSALLPMSAPPAASAATPAASGVPAEPRVTVIGDSVMTGVLWYPAALGVLDQNLDLHLEVAVCRRLTGQSCTFEGVTPPNLLDVVASDGHTLGPTVVVVMGYNDFASTFAAGVEESIQALLAAGVQRILWATLREVHHPYLTMNDTLRAAARRHPQLTILDWNMYARSHPEWFQNDGEHLLPAGGTAIATFLHAAIMRSLAAPPLAVASGPLPPAHVGRRYSAHLVARGGRSPYTWTLTAGRLPRGLTLRPDGAIVGTPIQPARARLVVRAADAFGRTATARDALTVTG